jgi:hypothetical protein
MNVLSIMKHNELGYGRSSFYGQYAAGRPQIVHGSRDDYTKPVDQKTLRAVLTKVISLTQ